MIDNKLIGKALIGRAVSALETLANAYARYVDAYVKEAEAMQEDRRELAESKRRYLDELERNKGRRS